MLAIIGDEGGKGVGFTMMGVCGTVEDWNGSSGDNIVSMACSNSSSSTVLGLCLLNSDDSTCSSETCLVKVRVSGKGVVKENSRGVDRGGRGLCSGTVRCVEGERLTAFSSCCLVSSGSTPALRGCGRFACQGDDEIVGVTRPEMRPGFVLGEEVEGYEEEVSLVFFLEEEDWEGE